MKKLAAFLLTCTMVVGLSACGTGGSTSSSSKEESKSVSTESSADSSAESTSEAKPESVKLTHSMGEIEVPYNPQKIAVLDLAALDILDALGLGDRVVGIPKKSSVSYLTAYIENEEIVNLGSVKEVDMEALNALEPDMIFIGGRLSSEYENINAIAPTYLLEVDREKGYMNSVNENVNAIASVFGEEEKAEELLAGFSSRVDALHEAAEGKTAIIGLVTSGSLSTLGNDSRCSLIGNEVGFENVAAEVDSTHGDSASFELILEKNPDYVFVLDRDTAINAEDAKTAKDVMENEIIMKTDAHQNDNIVYLTPDVWYLSEGGITATDTMLNDLEVGIN